LLNDKSQGVVRFNREEIITGVSDEAAKLSGYDKDTLLGKPLHFLIIDDTISRHALAVTDEGVAFRECELKLKRQDKEVVNIHCTFRSLSRDRGLGGYLSFIESREEPVIQPMEGTRGLDRLSWDRVEASLKQTGGNRTKAARVLGVGRATFYRFLEREKMQGRTPKTELV
jgi:PAS domain S-box-containing protein